MNTTTYKISALQQLRVTKTSNFYLFSLKNHLFCAEIYLLSSISSFLLLISFFYWSKLMNFSKSMNFLQFFNKLWINMFLDQILHQHVFSTMFIYKIKLNIPADWESWKEEFQSMTMTANIWEIVQDCEIWIQKFVDFDQ